jgi:hypothetical protein
MEILLAIVLIVSLTTLIAVAGVFVITVLPLYKEKVVEPLIPRLRETVVKDAYTPDDAYSEVSNLEDFTPDFSKPVKVVLTDENGSKMTMDGQDYSQVATDNVMEELTDEELQREAYGKN